MRYQQRLSSFIPPLQLYVNYLYFETMGNRFWWKKWPLRPDIIGILVLESWCNLTSQICFIGISFDNSIRQSAVETDSYLLLIGPVIVEALLLNLGMHLYDVLGVASQRDSGG